MLLPWLLALGADPALAAGLEREIRALLQNRALSSASAAVHVVSLTTHETIVAIDASTPLVPASNAKLVTAATALDTLGPGYVFTTRVGYRGKLEGGRLAGDLVVVGGGDPSFRDDFCDGDALRPLRDLAAQLKAAGVEEIGGDVVLDDGLFDRQFTAPTWPADQLNLDYCAPVAALSFAGNCLSVEVDPPASVGARAPARLVPQLPGLRVQSEILGTAVKGQNEVVLLQPDAGGRVLAKGKTWIGNPVRAFLVPVQNPPEYVGAALRRVLDDLRIRIVGTMRLATEAELGQACTVIAQVTSPIAPVLTRMLKDSDNNLAEHLFKLAGASRYRHGTFATGAAAVRDFLASLEIPENEGRFVDGSGLSRDNRISAAVLTTVLERAYVGAARDVFVKALPIAGVDGSLKNRMGEEPVCGRVRAKTGFINRVSALSGYVRTVSGESLAFSILMNNFQASNSTMKELQDDICRALVRYSPRERVNPGG